MNHHVVALCACLLIPARVATALAAPSPDVPCAPSHGLRFTSLQALPAPIPLEMLRRFAPDEPPTRLAAMAGSLMAQRDAEWQATDVVSPGPRLPGRRFILGFQAANQVWVWYQSGGIAHMFHVVVFEPGGDQLWRMSRHLTEGSVPKLCARLETEAASIYDRFW